MILRAFTEKDLSKIRALYREAFPMEERAPFALLHRRAKQGRGTLLVAVDRGVFCGFFYVLDDADLAYVFYFAVAKDERGRGCGSEMLALLRRYYDGKRLFLALEAPDDAAANAEQRLRRWRFYERNGFHMLPGKIKEGSVIYGIMGTCEAISAEEYEQLIIRWCGKWYYKLVDLKVLN